MVAVAEAATSEDETVRSQIPQHLRARRTLIICPAGLVDNWMEELSKWAPVNVLGLIQKCDSRLKLLQRMHTIDTWFRSSGVLVMSYHMFRILVLNAGSDTDTDTKQPDVSKKDSHRLNDYQYAQVRKQLLEGASLVIADEAHALKNADTKITVAARLIKTRSRIALTGSPLANHVEEYYHMIDWVAPNYLGPIAEFRDKYKNPIEQGLYTDSTKAQRRQSLKMLRVLHADLSPKINRATMLLLKNDLPPKKEFIITVPLSPLQEEMYSSYVAQRRFGQAGVRGELLMTTVWSWIADLRLICNHPSSYINHKRSAPAGHSKTASSTDNATPMSGSPIMATEESPIVVPTTLLKQDDLLAVDTALAMEAPDLSSKVMLFLNILDACKAVGDKVLVFSHSLRALDYLELLCSRQDRKARRLDGKTLPSVRQQQVKRFNEDESEVYLISTMAGGQGLNINGANRVVIFDFDFNPINEEQAIGRAYRIGQTKPVFVYRLIVGGTFEALIHNKAVFKTQLASRIIDKQNPKAKASRKLTNFLFIPEEVPQKDLTPFQGMDPIVLDSIIASEHHGMIRSVVETDCYAEDDDDKLTKEETFAADRLIKISDFKRCIAALEARRLEGSKRWDAATYARLQEKLAALELEERRDMSDVQIPVPVGRMTDPRRTAASGSMPASQPASVAPRTITPASQPASAASRTIMSLSQSATSLANDHAPLRMDSTSLTSPAVVTADGSISFTLRPPASDEPANNVVSPAAEASRGVGTSQNPKTATNVALNVSTSGVAVMQSALHTPGSSVTASRTDSPIELPATTTPNFRNEDQALMNLIRQRREERKDRATPG